MLTSSPTSASGKPVRVSNVSARPLFGGIRLRHFAHMLSRRTAPGLFAIMMLVGHGGYSLMAAVRADSSPIRYESVSRIFRLDAAETSYIFGVNEQAQLQTLYWGKRLPLDDSFPSPKSSPGASSFDMPINTTPQEFAGWGGGLYVEPDLKIAFADGNRDLVLKYLSYQIHEDKLLITMKDVSREVFVTLEYHMDTETGILRRSASIENRTNDQVVVEEIASGTWNLPQGDRYRLRYLTGRWAGEWNIEEQPIRPGKVVLESRRGTTGAQNNPWFAIEDGKSEDQEQGNVWFGALGWSGSWQMSIEQDQLQQVRITGGPNAFDFGYHLGKGQKLDTPPFYAGFSDRGIGGASRLLHKYEIGSILPGHPTPRLRPVLYNSWEATTFDVTEAGQMALAEKAASVGVERFVMDDGWFGERSNDHAGLGDWYADLIRSASRDSANSSARQRWNT
jgi:alpha-galactosidase